MRRLARPTVLLACLVLACCGSAGSPGAALKLPGSPSALKRPTSSHFVLIVLENRELGEAVGDRTAPYLQTLAHKGVLATDYHAITHPSLPNYVSLLAGDPLGIASDCTGCEAHGSTLLDQLEGAHIGWRAYMEGMPRSCYRGAESGGYVKRHDPFMYFPRIASDPSRCRNVVPLTRLAGDLRHATLPPFAWISPNLCDDGHDCANASVSRFLARLVPYLLAGLGPAGTLAVVWDEGSSNSGCCGHAAGGRVPLILLGPQVVPGGRLSTPADHYSLLALIEDSFGLPRLRGAACPCTPSIDGAFRQGAAPLLLRRGLADGAHSASGHSDNPAT
ncbi:MAG TPA: alkaline phosphatase family protein [Solirubrobacteraceae bacterium]|nr:alkaline phosphatase family protein [Solirubrobacteraceae bacterium]